MPAVRIIMRPVNDIVTINIPDFDAPLDEFAEYM